uniref:C2H2-type domain-containing protein n=1 Tax=Gongylonema pulchrum TaxID=637853 RepID=A0A183EDC9_9BILA
LTLYDDFLYNYVIFAWFFLNLTCSVQTDLEKNASPEMIICECCNKQFQTTNAYDNHVGSKKHKDNEARSSKKSAKMTVKKQPAAKRQLSDGKRPIGIDDVGGDSSDGDDDSDNNVDSGSDGWVTDHGTDDEDFDESQGIPATTCLFCNHCSDDVAGNLIHMSAAHGFFLPDAEYCIDKHMRDKGHCRVASSAAEMVEFGDFYDYSSMYPESDDVDESPDILVTDDGYTLTLPSGSLAVQRAKDIRYMKKLHSENWVKLGLSTNKLFVSRGRAGQ